MNTVLMIQESKNRWRIESEKGIVLQSDIRLGTVFEAEDYIKAYISSFLNWTYIMKPLGTI